MDGANVLPHPAEEQGLLGFGVVGLDGLLACFLTNAFVAYANTHT